MRTLRLLSLVGCLAGAGAAMAAASGPTFWTLTTAAEFLEGTSDGVAVSTRGTLRAGPSLANHLTSAPAQVWSLARTADGTLWAGTGPDGRVIRIAPGGAEETRFDADEANVFALSASGTRVFAATSPDGRVYVLDGDQTVREFFDPAEPYIWALAVDTSDHLWVGAGNPAALYRVAPDGSSQKVYEPPAAHVVSLGFDAEGRLLAGTESPGRLYRFGPENRPFVLLDSERDELRAFSVGPDGSVFAAAIDRAPSATDDEAAASVTAALSPPSDDDDTPTSILVRIEPSGTWEQLWSTTDVIYDLATDATGGVLVATGPAGRLYRVEPNRDVLLLTGVDARQITRFAAGGPTGVAAFATANPGRVIGVGNDVQTPARFVSPVHDTDTVATWGQIRWEATGAVRLFTRSGNTARPDDSWTDWSAPYSNAAGQPVTSPSARFLQWRAEFEGAAGADAELTAVTVAYLPRNNRPVVAEITVHPPGVVFQRPFVNDESAIAGLDDEIAEARRPPGDPGPTAPAPGRRMFQKGLQSIAWRARDDDGDRLIYALEYRRDEDAEWRLLREGLSGTIYVWDTTTVSDGRYVVRVRASDHASNVEDRALTGERESGAIRVDNTPPVLDIARAPNGGSLAVVAIDAHSPILRVEYSVAGGAWRLADPVDGLADSPEERYAIALDAGVDPTSVVVRATDLLQNVVSRPVP